METTREAGRTDLGLDDVLTRQSAIHVVPKHQHSTRIGPETAERHALPENRHVAIHCRGGSQAQTVSAQTRQPLHARARRVFQASGDVQKVHRSRLGGTQRPTSLRGSRRKNARLYVLTGKLPPLATMRDLAIARHTGSGAPTRSNVSKRLRHALDHIHRGGNSRVKSAPKKNAFFSSSFFFSPGFTVWSIESKRRKKMFFSLSQLHGGERARARPALVAAHASARRFFGTRCFLSFSHMAPLEDSFCTRARGTLPLERRDESARFPRRYFRK